MKQLESLNLENTGITGIINSKIQNLSTLSLLKCNECKLQGQIPQELLSLPNIQEINLSGNQLEGAIPDLPISENKLEFLFLNDNLLSGSLPKNTGSLKGLELKNNNLSGNITTIYSRAANTVKSLSWADLSNNNFSGELPRDLFNLSSLSRIDLSNNLFVGTIPNILAENSNLTTVTLSKNKLQGEVPKILLESPTIRNLHLDSNELQHLRDFNPIRSVMRELYLHRNNFEGSIPNSIGALPNLRILFLNNNKFTGRIPKNFGSLTLLSHVDLSNNRLGGKFPNSLASIPTLRELDIKNNLFFGELPEDIGEFNFQELSISGNHFAGKIPHSIFEKKIYFTLRFRNNHFEYSDEEIDELGSSNLKFVGKPQWRLPNQSNSYATIDLPHHPSLEFVQGPIQEGIGSQILIVPHAAIDFSNIRGCSGTLEDFIYIIPEAELECSIQVEPQACIDDRCDIIPILVNGVPNSNIENPAFKKQHSGVMHFRGWVPKQSPETHLIDWQRKHSLILDGHRQQISTVVNRKDVEDAMGTQEQRVVGWDLLVNMGNFDNTNHSAELVIEPGYSLDSSEFSSFSPKDRNDKNLFIRESVSGLYIDNFPVTGHRSELAFDVAEQKFSIVNQFDSTGISMHSSKKHYIEDTVELLSFNLAPEVSFPLFKTEKPVEGNLISGIVSFRGWLPFGDRMMNHRYYEADINGEIELALSLSERIDVSEIARQETPILLSGWSRFFYSGQLDNGLHRFRLYNRGSLGQKWLIYESTFESFTPVDNNGKQMYIRNNDARLTVKNFPFKGSEIDIQFNQAGQNFTMIGQRIDGKPVQ
ncbi:hypothetical protein [uncultured Pseudoteredinibacter sp.]|uniref:hypothetical protein n=1 Tax=uncultured Pseudoteredinibacter sp. TaxID=1641701 RepID=UPI00262E28E8|nr:hypothetical protein [uncultured Pseudoteredinibacter sp.]